MVGLGGSTNDGGVGVLAALGVKLLDAQGNSVEPTLMGLAKLAAVDFSGVGARVKEARITLMSDVTIRSVASVVLPPFWHAKGRYGCRVCAVRCAAATLCRAVRCVVWQDVVAGRGRRRWSEQQRC